MIALLAHHMEIQHVPVVLGIMAAGFWIGSNLVSKLIGRKK
jgi:hypothetical protein